MAQTSSPFFNIQYGWELGSSGWGDPVNTNLQVMSFLDKGAVDDFVGVLPGSPANGDSVVYTVDNQLYFRIGGSWLFVTPQEGMEINKLSDGTKWKFNGTSWVETLSEVKLADSSNPVNGAAAIGYEGSTVKARLDRVRITGPSDAVTYTFTPEYNTTNPECDASINTGGKLQFPNRLGHQIAFGRDDAPLLVTYSVPVSFTVSSGQPFRNIIFISKKAGLLQVFEDSELVVTGYGTGTINITPNAAKLSGSEEVTYWVIGDDDQFNSDVIQNNLQNAIGGYDNIVNRQMSYIFGAHNLIHGTGDHQGIYGSTYSVIGADNSYNAMLGGQNNQIFGIAGYSVAMGEGTRIQGSYSLIGGAYSFNGPLSKFAFSWGRSINLLDAEYSFAFGQDQTQNANHSAMWGQGCFNFGNDWSEACGRGAVARNAGARTFAISPTSSGADQETNVLVRGNLLAAGAWAKLLKIDGIDTIRLRASATAMITAHVVVNLSGGGNHYASLEVSALYNASLGIIGTSFVTKHSLGDGVNVEARIGTSLGTDTFYIEVRDGVTNRAGSAFAKLEVLEFLKA